MHENAENCGGGSFNPGSLTCDKPLAYFQQMFCRLPYSVRVTSVRIVLSLLCGWISFASTLASPLNNTEPPTNSLAPQPPPVSLGPEYTTTPPPDQVGVIGVQLGYTPVRKNIYIAGIIPGSPAEKAGLQKGDVIASIDSVNVHAILYTVSLSDGPHTFEGLNDISAVRKLLMGQPGRPVSVNIYRNKDDPIKLSDGSVLKFQLQVPMQFTVVRVSKNTLSTPVEIQH